MIRVYHLDGTVSKNTLTHFKCSSPCCDVEVYPNFISAKSAKGNYRFTNPALFSHGHSIYLGGDAGFDRSMFDNYANLLA